MVVASLGIYYPGRRSSAKSMPTLGSYLLLLGIWVPVWDTNQIRHSRRQMYRQRIRATSVCPRVFITRMSPLGPLLPTPSRFKKYDGDSRAVPAKHCKP